MIIIIIGIIIIQNPSWKMRHTKFFEILTSPNLDQTNRASDGKKKKRREPAESWTLAFRQTAE